MEALTSRHDWLGLHVGPRSVYMLLLLPHWREVGARMLHQPRLREQAVEGQGALGGGKLPNRSKDSNEPVYQDKDIVHVYHNLMSASN